MFITFEGPDGSGKTTQAKLLAEYLQHCGRTVCLTREPGGTELGKKIRTILLEDKSIATAPLAELFLFCADRAQHVREVIKPALTDGKIVICDRYVDSTTAYQSGGRKFDLKMIELLNSYSTEGLKPELTILVDVPAEIGLQRATKVACDKFEAEALSFHERVRQSYLEIAAREKRIKVFDGTRPIEMVFTEIKKLF
jgi:dTMP kinase